MATTTATRAQAEAPLRAGDLWVSVSAKGRGQPVKVSRVTPLNVQFRAFGRGADDSKTFSLPADVFRVRYAPLALADDRQKQLLRDDRNGVRPVLDGVPLPAPAEEPVPPAPAGRPGGGIPPKLAAEQAREAYLLVRGGTPRAEVATAYGVKVSVINDMMSGKTYRAALADLPAAAPEPQPEGEETTVETTPRYEAAAAPARPPRPQDDLLPRMADALEFLLEYAGRPLPKYLLLDIPGISRLVREAREAREASA